MSVYDTSVDPDVENQSHAMLVRMVGTGKDVLDVGCSTGFLAAVLRDRGNRVSGVEHDAEAAEKARPHLDRLVVGDLHELDLVAELGAGSFDTLVFGDVLEHLLDPVGVLRRAVPLLREGGSVVISIPNVAHGSLRLALLQGSWRYTDTGLLDRTHIRFVTRDSLLELLGAAGLVPVVIDRTVVDPLGGDVAVDAARLPAGVVDWVRAQPDADTYQFLVRAVPHQAAELVTQERRRAERLQADLEHERRAREDAERARQDAEAGLQRVLATKTFRALAGPRRLFARLRGSRAAR